MKVERKERWKLEGKRDGTEESEIQKTGRERWRRRKDERFD